jgi:hypothetical protein
VFFCFSPFFSLLLLFILLSCITASIQLTSIQHDTQTFFQKKKIIIAVLTSQVWEDQIPATTSNAITPVNAGDPVDSVRRPGDATATEDNADVCSHPFRFGYECLVSNSCFVLLILLISSGLIMRLLFSSHFLIAESRHLICAALNRTWDQ